MSERVVIALALALGIALGAFGVYLILTYPPPAPHKMEIVQP